MNYKAKDYGGGPATGLAEDFTGFLRNAITTGSFGAGTAGQHAAGANPVGDTGNIMSVLNSILQGPSAEYMSSINQMISTENTNNVNAVRSRFGAGGGMAMGTPAAYAEGVVRAEGAPRQAMAYNQIMGQNQDRAMNLLMPLFQMMTGLAGKGISQRETTLQEPGWMQATKLGMQLAPIVAAPFTGGASLAAAGSMPKVQAGMAGAGNGGNFGYQMPLPGIDSYASMPEYMPSMNPIYYG